LVYHVIDEHQQKNYHIENKIRALVLVGSRPTRPHELAATPGHTIKPINFSPKTDF